MKIAVVGCTGNFGSTIMKTLTKRNDAVLSHAITRPGNPFVGKCVSEITDTTCDIKIMDDIRLAQTCDVFIDCTLADTFMKNNYFKYQELKKPLVIATTAFSEQDMKKIQELATDIPILMTGNFSIALHHFLETVKFAAGKISHDTDIQIIEYHHKHKKDAPSGTALMIREALISANQNLTAENISISSVRGGTIFGEHEVIFANSKDEVVTFRHQVSSRETFADGAIVAAIWTAKQPKSLYRMEDCISKYSLV